MAANSISSTAVHYPSLNLNVDPCFRNLTLLLCQLDEIKVDPVASYFGWRQGLKLSSRKVGSYIGLSYSTR